MAISREDLANRILFLAGEKPIVRLTDKTDEAIAINTIYEQLERETFGMPNNWNFCTSRRQLVELADAPVCGWDHQYSFPANCLRVIALVDVNGDVLQRRFRREVIQSTANGRTTETNVILMNDVGESVAPYCKFILYRQDPNNRPAWFNRLFCHDAALTIVKPLSGEEPGKTTLERRRQSAYDDAVAANAMESGEISDNGQPLDHGHNMMEEINGRHGFRVTQYT